MTFVELCDLLPEDVMWLDPLTTKIAQHIAIQAMKIEREACANIAINGCLVPPDGGSPSEQEREMCEGISALIRARNIDDNSI